MAWKSRGEQLDVLVGAEHQFGALGHKRTPLGGAFLSKLMHSPVLVSDTPVFDVEGLRMAVGCPLAGEFADRLVAIFHPVAHLLHCACPGVGADERLATDFPAPFDKLVCTEGVRVLDLPGLVPNALPVGSNGVFPVVG